MNFFNKIKSSIYDPEFYSRALAGENTHPFKYFLKLITLVAFVYALIFAFTGAKDVKVFLDEAGDSIVAHYPKELEVKFEKGNATSNVAEPYFIKIPEEFNKEEGEEYENLLVIETKSDLNLEKFKSYKTFALLSKDSLVSQGTNGRISIIPLKDVPDSKINYDEVSKWYGNIKPFINALPYIFPILVFLGIILVQLFTLIYLLFGAFIVWIIGKMKNLDIPFKKAYHLSLHLVTLQIILTGVLYLSGNSVMPFFPTLVFVAATWFNLKNKLPEVLVQN